MKIYEKNNVKFLVFENMEKAGFINHCFSTKIGGISKGDFASLNLGFARGDKKENVEENFRRISCACGFDYKNMVFGTQTHDNKVLYVDEGIVESMDVFKSNINGFDGFITDKEEVTLVTFHADCVPLFFADRKNKVIALSHAGWRGTVKNIAGETIKKMQKKFKTEPKDVIAGIAPSIGGCCFQVGEEVVLEFTKEFDFAHKYIENDKNTEAKFKIDLWGINKELIIKSGVLEENIEAANMCTMCNEELFYSHRRQGEKRGSLAAFMCIRAKEL